MHEINEEDLFALGSYNRWEAILKLHEWCQGHPARKLLLYFTCYRNLRVDEKRYSSFPLFKPPFTDQTEGCISASKAIELRELGKRRRREGLV